MPHLLCLGLGYSARVLAAELAADGWRISGSARTAEGAAAIDRAGCEGIVFGGRAASPRLAQVMASATHLLVSAPPGPDGDPVLARHGDDIRRADRLEWIGYLSTIGVYGDAAGAWVDETTAPRPGNERSRWRLSAEEAWTRLAAEQGSRLQIFRLAGIYGPGQSAIDQMRAGTARRIVKPGQVFNRIHVEDIAAAVRAGMEGRGGSLVYNLADDEPAPPQDVIAFAADLLGVPPPPAIPFETADLSEMARSFYAEVKRVRNTRLKAELLPALRHPTYREGLRAILAASAGRPGG